MNLINDNFTKEDFEQLYQLAWRLYINILREYKVLDKEYFKKRVIHQEEYRNQRKLKELGMSEYVPYDELPSYKDYDTARKIRREFGTNVRTPLKRVIDTLDYIKERITSNNI